MSTSSIEKKEAATVFITWTKYILQKITAAEEAQEFKFHSVRRMVGNSTIVIPETNVHLDGIFGIFEPNDEVGLLYNARDDAMYIAIRHGENFMFGPTLSDEFRELLQKRNPSTAAIIMRGIDGFKCALKSKCAAFKMESEIALGKVPVQIQ